MQRGYFHTVTAAAISIMFLMNVSQFVSFIASPKHPQSLTGLAMAIHKVITVIMLMNTNIILETICLLIAKSMNTPKQNSSEERRMDEISVKMSGIYDAI